MAGDINIDINGDGVVATDELEIHKSKMKTQRRIAFIALLTMCFLGIYITIYLPIDRVAQVSQALDLLWFTLGGVIATYMGAEAYISRN